MLNVARALCDAGWRVRFLTNAEAVRGVLTDDRFAEASARIGTSIAGSPRAAGIVELIERGIYRQRVQSDSRVAV